MSKQHLRTTRAELRPGTHTFIDTLLLKIAPAKLIHNKLAHLNFSTFYLVAPKSELQKIRLF